MFYSLALSIWVGNGHEPSRPAKLSLPLVFCLSCFDDMQRKAIVTGEHNPTEEELFPESEDEEGTEEPKDEEAGEG